MGFQWRMGEGRALLEGLRVVQRQETSRSLFRAALLVLVYISRMDWYQGSTFGSRTLRAFPSKIRCPYASRATALNCGLSRR